MTPEERNTVIEALEASLSLIDQIDFETGTIVAAALAIMRGQGPCRHEWVNGGPMNNYKTFCAYCATAGD